MLENDYLSRNDIVGTGVSQIADGGLVDHTKIILKKIEIGGLVLTDVEAVVIHQQSAPLLLGQSAIQKLGKVSISGNQLTISSTGTNPYIREPLTYSEEEYEEIYSQAKQLLKNGNYILASEKYDLLYAAGQIYIHDIINYARCLGNREVKRYDDALDVLLRYECDVKEQGIVSMDSYYSRISATAYWAGEYNLAIKYGRLCQSVSEFPMEIYADATDWISASYDKLNDKYQSRSTRTTFISQYLKFMEISAVDCWDKDYKDPFLADQYYALALCYDTYYDSKKYYIIAAAWGDKNAIEICRKFKWSYNNKPSEYVY